VRDFARRRPGNHALSAPDSVDARTRRLYDAVRSRPANQALARTLDEARATNEPDDVRLALVPGLFHREHPHTGADGAFLERVARDLGLEVETLPVDGSAGLDASADAINDWLIATADARPVLLFTLSMGSNEVRHALTRNAAARAFANVRAWTSISGLPFGSAAVDLTLANPLRRAFVRALCRLKGWHYENLRDVVRHRPDAPFALPAHVRFVQVAAFPQREHLRDRRSRRLHRWLARFGPSDGFALLDELAALPGELYPVWAADHYLNGAAELDGRLAALIRELAPGPDPG
jgi:hypothetical protein